jgi:hypothetical protein
VVRFAHPASAYTERSALLETKPLMVIESDCISVNIQNSKNSFAKMCQLVLKPGDSFYYNSIAPGDWVCVWIHDEQHHIEEIAKALRELRSRTSNANQGEPFETSNILNNWESGLKFVGRVIQVVNSESVSRSGVKTTAQILNCQAFTEMASSVYFTQYAKLPYDPAASGNKNGQSVNVDLLALNNFLGKEKYKSLVPALMDRLLNVATDSNKTLTPDSVIPLLITHYFGIDKNDYNQVAQVAGEAMRGSFSDAISVPKLIAEISGTPNARKLWQMYNYVLGMQRYGSNQRSGEEEPWRNFNPSNIESEGVFTLLTDRCKGYIVAIPPLITNNSLWNLLNQYLNPVVNEMYTALRCDRHNRIRPTLIVREKPFSTGLYNYLWNGYKMTGIEPGDKPTKQTENSNSINKSNKESFKGAKNQTKSSKVVQIARSFYGDLPRWVIDESVIVNLSVATNEQNRVNMVQLFGKNILATLGAGPQNSTPFAEAYKQVQLLKNYVVDDQDITRNGLRAIITETEYDIPLKDNSYTTVTHIWVRMMADWYFNGHLKPSGTVTLFGVYQPIAEGDNVEIRGVVYHIDSVQHQASISSRGERTFMTTLSISNGILASSLRKHSDIPAYPVHTYEEPYDNEYGPGYTDYQLTLDSDRNDGIKRSRK